MNDDSRHMRESVMKAIHEQEVRMRPRWQFVLVSVLVATGTITLMLAIMYALSLAVFFLHQSGAWFVPAFGARGWMEFMRSVPWLLVVLVSAFIVLLEVLVRRYQFVYRKPLMLSVAGIIGLIALGSTVLAVMPFHGAMAGYAIRGVLPPPVDQLYRPDNRRIVRTDSIHRGMIVGTSSEGFMVAEGGDGDSVMVVVSGDTRLPYGQDFTVGDIIVVVGDRVGTGTVRAFGIRSVEREPIDDRW